MKYRNLWEFVPANPEDEAKFMAHGIRDARDGKPYGHFFGEQYKFRSHPVTWSHEYWYRLGYVRQKAGSLPYLSEQ